MATNQLIHYALDLEDPTVLACDTPARGAIYSPTASEVTCPRCRKTEHFPLGILPPQSVRAPIITPYNVLMNAADLLSDDGENPEYDRAIVELTGNLIGAGPDDRILMARILRALAEGTR